MLLAHPGVNKAIAMLPVCQWEGTFLHRGVCPTALGDSRLLTSQSRRKAPTRRGGVLPQWHGIGPGELR